MDGYMSGGEEVVYQSENVKVTRGWLTKIITDRYVANYDIESGVCNIIDLQAKSDLNEAENLVVGFPNPLSVNLGSTAKRIYLIQSLTSAYNKHVVRNKPITSMSFQTENEFLSFFLQHNDSHIIYGNAFDINVKIENLLIL